MCHPYLIKAAHADMISVFCRVVRLEFVGGYGEGTPPVALHGFSPALRSLHLKFGTLPDWEIFGLICSFPLLEDLALISHHTWSLEEERSTPSTSPNLTGSLKLRFIGGRMQSTTNRLLDLPNGVHFTTIAVYWLKDEDIRSTTDLVSRCSETLQTLEVTSNLIGVFPSIPRPDWRLTATHVSP